MGAPFTPILKRSGNLVSQLMQTLRLRTIIIIIILRT